MVDSWHALGHQVAQSRCHSSICFRPPKRVFVIYEWGSKGIAGRSLDDCEGLEFSARSLWPS